MHGLSDCMNHAPKIRLSNSALDGQHLYITKNAKVTHDWKPFELGRDYRIPPIEHHVRIVLLLDFL